jgi:hypothetical protein
MQIQDHDKFPKFDHRVLPPAKGRSVGDSARRPTVQGMPSTVSRHKNWGIFKCHKWGELLRHSHSVALRQREAAVTRFPMAGGLGSPKTVNGVATQDTQPKENGPDRSGENRGQSGRLDAEPISTRLGLTPG